MIDPFFLDRLMHAFTSAHTAPLQPVAAPTSTTPACRPLREAEAVAAAAFRSQETTSAELPQGDRDA